MNGRGGRLLAVEIRVEQLRKGSRGFKEFFFGDVAERRTRDSPV